MTINGKKLNMPRFEMGENARMAFRTLREHPDYRDWVAKFA